MSDLDQLAISRILGSTFQPYSRTNFGGFSTAKAVGEMLATRPKRSENLAADTARDAKIVKAFSATHKGFSVDRLLADPNLTRQFIRKAQMLGVGAPPVLINRRLLGIRKTGRLKVETTVVDKRDLSAFLIPAELAFAQMSYQFEASYDDLLTDPAIGSTFDALALAIGGGGDVVSYRLAALNLRKNIRTRRSGDAKKMAMLGAIDLDRKWHIIGPIARIIPADVPGTEGIFAISEPDRYLFLTRHRNMRKGVLRFHDPALLDAVSNRFWKPSPERMTLQLIRREEATGVTLRLLELKALETYRPIFNLLPASA